MNIDFSGLIIALDFDETITADPVLWEGFIALAKSRGHSVTIVTLRPEKQDNSDIIKFATKHNINVVFTAGKQKEDTFKADIWIDDIPALIPNYNRYHAILQWKRKRGLDVST